MLFHRLRYARVVLSYEFIFVKVTAATTGRRMNLPPDDSWVVEFVDHNRAITVYRHCQLPARYISLVYTPDISRVRERLSGCAHLAKQSRNELVSPNVYSHQSYLAYLVASKSWKLCEVSLLDPTLFIRVHVAHHHTRNKFHPVCLYIGNSGSTEG